MYLIPVLVLTIITGGCAGGPAPTTTTPTNGATTPAISTKVTPKSSATVGPDVTPAATSPLPLEPSSSAGKIIEKVRQSVADVSAYRLERAITATKTIKNAVGSGAYKLSVWSTMQLNLAERQLQMDNTFDITPPAGQPDWPSMENLIYIRDDTFYIKGLFPAEPQRWGKTAATAEYWQKQDQLAALMDFLNNDAVVLAPEYSNNGRTSFACDVIQITPDLETFWALILEQPGVQTFELPAGPPPGLSFSQLIPLAKMKLWISQIDGSLVRAELVMNMRIGPAQLATLKSDLAMDISVNMNFQDYNQPFPLSLPLETKEAIELNIQPSP
jgi:hypothetical protein